MHFVRKRNCMAEACSLINIEMIVIDVEILLLVWILLSWSQMINLWIWFVSDLRNKVASSPNRAYGLPLALFCGRLSMLNYFMRLIIVVTGKNLLVDIIFIIYFHHLLTIIIRLRQDFLFVRFFHSCLVRHLCWSFGHGKVDSLISFNWSSGSL